MSSYACNEVSSIKGTQEKYITRFFDLEKQNAYLLKKLAIVSGSVASLNPKKTHVTFINRHCVWHIMLATIWGMYAWRW